MKPIYTFLFFTQLVFGIMACQDTNTTKESSMGERYSEAIFENSKYIEDKKYRVYVPPSYFTKSEKTYPVLYMMDGNNLFTNSEAMGGMSWNIQQMTDSLVQAKAIKECIIVGVDHAAEKRFAEYMPQTPLEDFLKINKDTIPEFIDTKVFSNAFLKFIVEELKPHIDQQFRTKKDINNTFIGGASMGGLISMYAICEYPTIFGGALCLSTHWSVSLDNSTHLAAQALVNYLENNLPTGKKWYFDHGTESLDQYYEPYQTQVDRILEQKGYRKDIDWMSREYVGATHNEVAWNQRLHIPLTFILKDNKE